MTTACQKIIKFSVGGGEKIFCPILSQFGSCWWRRSSILQTAGKKSKFRIQNFLIFYDRIVPKCFLKEITLWRRAELNENRIPTNQFIGSQLPNGHFKTGKGDSISNQKQASTESSAPESEKTQEAPEAAFWPDFQGNDIYMKNQKLVNLA